MEARELEVILSNNRTSKIAYICTECGEVNIISAKSKANNKCYKCQGHLYPKGYAKEYFAISNQRNKPIQREAAEQEALFSWAQMQTAVHPELELMYHIPNGGSRNPKEAANLKLQGVKSGVPDIHLPIPKGIYHGLYIELKEPSGKNKPTSKQLEWLERLRNQGYAAIVCYGFEQAKKEILSYLKYSTFK